MYSDHYGLNGNPFQLTPDPRFWFESETHRKAMAYLGYGLAQGGVFSLGGRTENQRAQGAGDKGGKLVVKHGLELRQVD